MSIEQGGIGALESVIDCVVQIPAAQEFRLDVLGGVDAGIDSEAHGEQDAEQSRHGELNRLYQRHQDR